MKPRRGRLTRLGGCIYAGVSVSTAIAREGYQVEAFLQLVSVRRAFGGGAVRGVGGRLVHYGVARVARIARVDSEVV